MDLNEIGKEAKETEKEIGLTTDDILNKLTQELGEFNDAVQKYRGRFCRQKAENTDNIKEELGDVLLNLISVCKEFNINPNEFSIFANNTLKKFKDRKELYKNSIKNKKITICGSIAFYDEMLEIKQRLELQGHEVKLPPKEVKDKEGNLMPAKEYYNLRQNANENEKWIWERKKEAMKLHFEKVEWAEAIVVLNYDKKGIKNYIGSNTLMEMGLALNLDKKIFLLNPIPEISAKEEILGMHPIILNGDLTKIK